MGERYYSPIEYQQMKGAALEAMVATMSDEDGSLATGPDIARRAAAIVGEARLNREGQIVYPYGGRDLVAKMQSEGPFLREDIMIRSIYGDGRRTIRKALKELRDRFPAGATSREEEAQRRWFFQQLVRELYMLPLRWKRIEGATRNAAFFESVERVELEQVVATQQTIKNYGDEGMTLFTMVVDEMVERGATEHTTIKEIFGARENGTEG